MRRFNSLLLLFLCLKVAAAAGADDPLAGEIRLKPEREGFSWVGQELELQLELWTEGYSFGDQLFQLPDVPGGFLMQADSATVKLSENRNGAQWQGLRYTLLLYPQREGTVEVPSFDVRFSSGAGFGTQPTVFNFQTEPLSLETRLPPGVSSRELLVTTTDFSVDAAWKPRPGEDGGLELKVGDAVTLAVSRRAQDVPGMVFPPLPAWSIDGLAVYAGTPQVNDRVNRGSLTGTRSESITVICERAGAFEIPELRFQWWDPEREALEERVVPALSLQVAPHPGYAAGGAGARGTVGTWGGWKTWVFAVIALGSLGLAVRRFMPALAAKWRLRRLAREAGEPWAFKQVMLSCSSGTASEAYNAINLWLSRVEEFRDRTLLRLAGELGNEKLSREAQSLQACVAAGSQAHWSGRDLARELTLLRKQAGNKARQVSALQALNPAAVKSR